MRRIAFVAGCVLALLAGLRARADEQVPSLLTGFNLTSWTQKDGITSPLIWSLAQDHTGYLWIGTDGGLLRFDGVRFVRWDELAPIPNPAASVRSLCVAGDGALWFGLSEPGGIGVLRNGGIRMYGTAEGLPPGVVMSIVRAQDGTLWAGGLFGAFRLVADRWERSGEGLPPGLVNALFVDADGSILAATAEGVYSKPPDGSTFARVGPSDEIARALARGSDGRIWVTDPIVGFRPARESRGAALDGQKGRGSRLLNDSRGNLWVGTGGQGLWRVQHEPSGAVRRFQRTSTMTGMSDDGVTDLLEDRDGNIWVATRDGLNRLTPHKMTPIMDLGIVNAVDVTPEGRVWVGTADAVVAFEGGTITSRSAPVVIPNPPLTAMHADDRGTLWIASADELSRIVRGRREVVPLRGNALRNLTDITSDGAGGLWLHDAELGLWNWRHGQLAPAAVPAPLQLVPLLASYTDRERRAWFAYQNGRVARIEPSGALSVFGDADGLTAGPYRSIHQDRTGAIWFGGNRGLSLFAHGEFRTLPPLMATALLPITGIVDDESGNLWLALEGAGLLRLSGAELARALAEPGYRPRSTGYDKVDGSAGTSRWFGHRAAVRATDGRLWFVAGRGVTVVDPDALDDAMKPASAAVRIEGAIVDGRRLSTASARALPPRPARLQIDYTVLNLTSPLKTRYRHRLDGFDADWIDAGMNHSASYTNLPPRAYTFRVMATADDGSFSEPAAEWAFSIEPMFYQTWWFAAAVVAAIALAIGVAWRLHVLTVRRRFALLLGERARLSREVHDTLLQSMFGFALQVDALGAAVAGSAPELRSRLASLRHQVEEDIREARQSIWNLRSPKLEAQDLPSALKDAAEHAAASNGVRPVFAVSGEPRRAPAAVEEQLLRIGREAISNVVRHAHAHEMQVALQYDEDRIVLRVRDDGQGFEPSAQSAMAEHFGLTTMRERAESVGGTLVVDAHPGTGTTVTVVIPDAHS